MVGCTRYNLLVGIYRSSGTNIAATRGLLEHADFAKGNANES